ncbi:MAG: signal peptidase I [Sarcina sp.]
MANKTFKIKPKKIFTDWICPIFLALILAFLVNKFLIFKVEIPSKSMIPTLNIDDQLFASRVYNPEKLERGDLVIFYFKPEDKLYIKRLIGLPGDNISIVDGVVHVNGQILEEDYVKNQEKFNGDFKVPAKKYFFLGDNRGNSLDSRRWRNPYIDAEDIKGKAFIKVYPFNDIKILK